MAERVLPGLAAAPGVAGARARVAQDPGTGAPTARVPPERRADEARRGREALLAAGAELEALAGRLAAEGRETEAEIVATGVLMAADPGLVAEVERLVTEEGQDAAAAVQAATGAHADAIAAIGDATLAARAEDVRSLGRRAARITAAGPAAGEATPGDGAILVAHDLGPADVAELGDDVVGIALSAGAPTAHAAVVARGLGLPMAVGLGPELLEARPGEPVVIDGDAGQAVLRPAAARLAAARDAVEARARVQADAAAERALPAVTRDGRPVRVLVNAASVPELEAGLAAGAEGVGLLRTELAFLDVRDWPTEAQHAGVVAPLLDRLAGRPATVRVLDFGGDKTPPLLAGTRGRGLELLLAHPPALDAQLRGVLGARGASALRILLPVVESAAQVRAVRSALRRVAEAPGGAEPTPLGAMIETRAGVAAVREVAGETDFLSIGTNDLTHSVLGTDRFAGGPAGAQDPRVVAAVAAICEAAEEAGIDVEVCGEAASDAAMLAVLVGLGVAELSVGPARVGAVRRTIRALDSREAAALPQGGDAPAQGVDRGGGVVTLGPDP